jgi:ribosome-associated protein
LTSYDKARRISALAADKKGESIVLLEIKKLSSMCDWLVIVSSTSSRRIKAIANSIKEGMSKEHVRPLHVEGLDNPYWALLDYGDVVVHIFFEDIREFYGLERLWSDAPLERFEEKCTEKKSQ